MNAATINTENRALERLRANVGAPAPAGISPVFTWLGPTLTAADRGVVEFRHQVREEWLNPLRTLHGGILATMMDDAIGVAVFSLGLPEFFTTINLNADYFVPVQAGQEINVRAEIVKEGKQILHAVCEVRLAENGRLIARASSNLMKTGIPKQQP